MEIAELVLEYVKTLVWPVVTLTLVWGLRAHIQYAFTRMTRLETPAGAIEFEADAREVRQNAEELSTNSASDNPTSAGSDEPVPEQEESPQVPSPQDAQQEFDIYESARITAIRSPALSVIRSWDFLQEDLTHALNQRRIPDPPNGDRWHPWDISWEHLHRLGLEPGAVSVYMSLKDLWDRAAHTRTVVTPQAANNFIASCRDLSHQVNVRYHT
ncbi:MULTISPECIES: hypothetical protein [unclassified Streptomyces]|uniref:hypothetical protein n=1 Tax=unclassified Streptomyces TaxID=2593676 RepID=UPI0011615083|nr:hypothetical protein [Streptomyces sp. CB01580]